MTYINCQKRQKEVVTDREGNKKIRYRCVEKKVTDTYLQIIPEETCLACPILAANNATAKTCDKRPEWENHLISVTSSSTGIYSEGQSEGYDQPCPYRWEGKCRITGHEINPEICRACDQETADEMASTGILDKAGNWALAVKRWIREGRPTRTKEEATYIFEKWCKTCELYDEKAHACKKCGCQVSKDKSPLANKLRMKTEVCPMKLWE